MASQPKAQKAPLLPRLFAVDCIRVLQAQFFDNSASPPKRGRSQFALKLFAWTDGNIDFQQPHWWRVVQLLEPSKVLKWAAGKRDAGEMTADQFGLYQMAYEGAARMIEDGSRVWMGHIGSPSGKHYFVGQFVLARWEDEDTLRAVVFNGDRNILLDRFQKPRKRGRIARANAPKLVALYDLTAALQRQDDIEEANRTGRTLREVLEARPGVSHG